MEKTTPTAAELGISEVEYEQIRRDLDRRYRTDVPDPLARPTAPAARRQRRARSRWWNGLMLGLAALWLVARVVSHLGGTASSEPAYAFLEMSDGHPVAYSSCKPVQVAVYPSGGPPDAEALVREAVAQLRPLTGLDIVVTGVFGGHAPGWNFKAAPFSAGDPVGVSWQDGDAIDQLTDDIAGLGGSPSVAAPSGTKYRIGGTIALSRDYYQHLTETDDHAEALAVLLHEFGHVLGLDHVKSSGELMYDDNIGRTTFGPGDLEGLRQLGKGPCV